ncbi:MAG: hypothetical protein GEU95_04035 [Rhizobiales bacterium]|nr:hypothetical protein [Hyphomicrobiales bacterium]
MLDGQRYFAEFPDEEPEEPRRLLLSEELLVSLAAIEREISAFIRGTSEGKSDTIGAAANSNQAKE